MQGCVYADSTWYLDNVISFHKYENTTHHKYLVPALLNEFIICIHYETFAGLTHLRGINVLISEWIYQPLHPYVHATSHHAALWTNVIRCSLM